MIIEPKLKLQSDFNDIYDVWFDCSADFIYHRMMKDNVTRPMIFKILNGLFAFKTPFHGICKYTQHLFAKDNDVVIYTDEYAHGGNGKILTKYDEALEYFPDYYISEYIKTIVASISSRYLCIGDRAWILSYVSDDEWRSNVGDVKITIEKELEPICRDKCKLPMFAIDLVQGLDDVFYAVDFNSAPGLKYTGIEDIVKPRDIVNLIKEAYFNYR
jgi:hypothetical protein